MVRTRVSTIATLLAAWAVATFLATGAIQAQTSSFKDYVKKQEIEAQKLEKAVQQALAEARRLQFTKPVSALNLLKNYQYILENDTLLPKTTRAQLLQYVTERVRQIERMPEYQAAVRKKTPPPDSPPQKLSKEELLRKYQQYGKGNAGRGPYDAAKRLYSGIKGQIAYDRELKQKIEAMRVKWWRSVREGTRLPKGDFEYPDYWRTLTESRKKFTGPQLTKQEAALLKTMNSVLSVDYNRAPFKLVIEDLQKRTGQTIFVDPNSLKEANVEYDTPVTLQAKKITVRTALRTILRQLGLTYILKDGIIQVMTEDEAARHMTIRAYPIAGLMPPPAPGTPPYIESLRRQAYANQIMLLIANTVQPQSWAINGGRGTMWYDPISGSIVVRQTAELHLPVARALGGSGFGGR